MNNVLPIRNTRRHERRTVCWDAVVEIGEGVCIPGTIRDFTPYGVFFSPDERAFVDGYLVDGNEALLEIELGKEVNIIVADHSGRPGCKMPSIPRWIGESLTHNRMGFGCEFSHRMKIAA